VGPNVTETWTVNGSNAGTVGVSTFSNFQNLTGGTLNDTFKFASGGNVSGVINGGTGTNTLDYSGDGGVAASINLTTATATNTGGISNIQTFVGSSSTADVFLGPNASNVWSITGVNAGTVGSYSFSAFENVTGGLLNDTFKLTSAGSVTGMMKGNTGTNTIDYSGDGGIAATVNLASLTATKTGGIYNIQSFVGSSSTADTLVGPNVASTWTINAANAGSVGSFTFSAVENLTGGTLNDSFAFTSAGSESGMVKGNTGTNTLDYSGDGGVAATVNLTSLTATKTGGIYNIQNFVGSSSTADTLIGPATANTWTLTAANTGSVGSFTFSAVENLTGGTLNDTFAFNSGGSVSGKIDGGTGTNTLNYSSDGGVAATVNLNALTATKTGGFANIQSLVGSSSTADTLIGANTANAWSITAANTGTVNSFSFSGVENLTGGTSTDEFVFSVGATVSGEIDGGGGGYDWLDYAAFTTPVTVNLTTWTATGVGGGLARIRAVRGGQGGDTLTGNTIGNILIGGSGTNTIVGGSGESILIGGKGKDTVTGNSGSDILIAGYTDYDTSSAANDAALDAILLEWQSTDSYSSRISKIKAGVGSGGYKFVWGTTVHDNSTSNANTLTGGGGASGLNWFFANVSHTTTNKTGSEELN
jgi:hypothetical protein